MSKHTKLYPKFRNPIPDFQTHGLKTIGDYEYNLLINMDGEAIIQKVKSDKTEILYTLKAEGVTIATFWADPASHDYDYLNKLI